MSNNTFHISGSFPFQIQIIEEFSSQLQWSTNLYIAFILEGSLSLQYSNHTRDFNAHDIYFFSPFNSYSIISSTANSKVFCIEINSQYLHKLCPEIASIQFQQNHVSSNINNPVYYELCHNFSSIVFYDLKKEVSSPLKIMQSVLNLATIIIDHYGIRIKNSTNNEYTIERAGQIIEYINENYMNKITLSDISSHIGIHPQYFSSVFQKDFHMGFVEYLTQFRVNHSLYELTSTKMSILEIAINNGFSNHKTYAAAFRKYYQISPTQYRKKMQQHILSATNKTASKELGDSETYSFFRQFLLSNSSLSTAGASQTQQFINLNTQVLKKIAKKNPQDRFLSLGRAYACLRSEIQKQILETKKDYDFQFLRIRDIFSDDLYIYFEKDNQVVYNWAYLDEVFDFILSAGLKPFPEIGYMPAQLAAKKAYAPFQYHPNISYPRSFTKWYNLIVSFLTHYIKRYGIEELRSWYFEFWTNPDLQIKNPYWVGTMEDFFEFYKLTYEAFQSVDSKLRLGSPNFSVIDGFPWYDAFFSYCNNNNIHPSFVSARFYGCKGIYRDDLMLYPHKYSVTTETFIYDRFLNLKAIMEKNNFSNTDVIVSDWNLSFFQIDYIRDSSFMAPYICHTMKMLLFDVKGLFYSTLNDNYEDFFPDSNLFHGGAGLLDAHNFKKASYNAMVLFGKLGKTVLSIGENYIFTQDGREYQLLLYNLPSFDSIYENNGASFIDSKHRYELYANVEKNIFTITMQLPKGAYFIKKYEVNREYGSAYDIWANIGFPPNLTKDLENYIESKSVPQISYSYQNVEQALFIDEEVPPFGIMLLRFIPQQ